MALFEPQGPQRLGRGTIAGRDERNGESNGSNLGVWGEDDLDDVKHVVFIWDVFRNGNGMSF